MASKGRGAGAGKLWRDIFDLCSKVGGADYTTNLPCFSLILLSALGVDDCIMVWDLVETTIMFLPWAFISRLCLSHIQGSGHHGKPRVVFVVYRFPLFGFKAGKRKC